MGTEDKYVKNPLKQRGNAAIRKDLRERIGRINEMADKETAKKAGVEEAYDLGVRQANEEEYSPRGRSERHYKDGGKVQKSSSRRKEEGLDTEIVVEPKKFSKGGKVKC